jgi:hypothetical protein
MKPHAPFLLMIALLGCAFAVAGERHKACADPKYGQFDFWIGEWEVSVGGKVVGHNTIEPILDGCVLQENWRSASGGAGTSLNFYDPNAGQWKQFWVYRNGTPLPLLTGAFADGKMILSGTGKDGKGNTILNRITWTDNEDGTVRQHWQISGDGGETWKTSFDGLYRRK